MFYVRSCAQVERALLRSQAISPHRLAQRQLDLTIRGAIIVRIAYFGAGIPNLQQIRLRRSQRLGLPVTLL